LNNLFINKSDEIKFKNLCLTQITDEVRSAENKLPVDSTIIFKANRKRGFNFDYVIYFPKDIDTSQRVTLLVESTNTGLSDSMDYHLEKAIHAASKSSVGNFVSRKLNIPILVPVFPRSNTDWEVYTHAFDSDTFNQRGSDIEHIDLQLLAMVEDAKVRLKEYGLELDERFFLTGFSASGTFANRFALLHPDKLKAVVAGGLNGLLIIPKPSHNGYTLNFPLGTADVEQRTGKKINLDAFKNLPQLLFMGEFDSNDAIEFDDGYTDDERATVYSAFSKKMMPYRWDIVKSIYREMGIKAVIKTFGDIGHSTDLALNTEISEFFRRYK
jgi:pimeloyl-ACP methyl ester carboxylesterase